MFLLKGDMFINFLATVQGAMFIQGATFILDSRVCIRGVKLACKDPILSKALSFFSN
jgi:hypothetical protein